MRSEGPAAAADSRYAAKLRSSDVVGADSSGRAVADALRRSFAITLSAAFLRGQPMSKPLEYFSYHSNTLGADGVSLEEIASRVGTPAYVYSAEAFRAPFRQLSKGMGGTEHLICFAVKANPSLAVLKLLGDEGAGMDVVSGGEMQRALTAGVPAERIVFSGVGKTEDEIRAALLVGPSGVLSFNVESAPELRAISAIALKLGRKARVAFRFNPDVDAKTHPYISTGLKKNKFGVYRKELLELVRAHADYPGIEIRGISIHIGSQLTSLAPLGDAFARLRKLVEEINAILPSPLATIDLGGGLGITYRNEKPPEPEKYTKLVLKYFGGLKAKIILEPGRMICGNAGVLLTRVVYRKHTPRKDFLIVDAAMNDLLRPALYGSYHEVVPIRKVAGKALRTDLVGPVCESSDCFAGERMLSSRLDAGDLLALLSAGAYGFSMSSNYNSRPRIAEVLIAGGQFRVIRERETFADLVRGEHL